MTLIVLAGLLNSKPTNHLGRANFNEGSAEDFTKGLFNDVFTIFFRFSL